jgi:predicted amidohydrolase
MTTDELKLALWQGAGTSGDVTANLLEIGTRAEQAASAGAQLLVFPECFLTGYVTRSPMNIVADVSEETREELVQISAQTGLALIVGSYARLNDSLVNAAFVVDPEKGLIGTYRKQMLYGAWEKATFQRGKSPLTFTYRGWRIGLLICFDVEFPEIVRALARQGCDLVVVPTALMEPYDNVARHVIATRALENQMFVAYANRTGCESSNIYVGRSVIAGPNGAVIAQAGDDTEQMLLGNLSRAEAIAIREEFSYLDELGS